MKAFVRLTVSPIVEPSGMLNTRRVNSPDEPSEEERADDFLWLLRNIACR
ncbi:MAG: hypothetical protein ACLP29_07440 [Dissulfurispiraceae bacterium]